MRIGIGLFGVSVAAFALVPACEIGKLNLAEPNFDAGVVGDGGSGTVAPRGVGARCDDGGTCRGGLACTAGVCQPGRSLESGSACVISAECKDGLYCGLERTCVTAGEGVTGGTCASDGDCKSGLRCALVGLDAQCQPEGTKDVGDTCAVHGDCYGGLFCAGSVCAPPPPGGLPPLGVPTTKGVECETETGPVTAHFRVPSGTPEDKDYFRLPFPNDIHMKGPNKLDLKGFPRLGPGLAGYDVVARWADYLEETGTGWSAYPTVTFRFSGEIEFDTLSTGDATSWVDITTGEGDGLGHNWGYTTGRSQYACPNALSFRPNTGKPLKPGHTYAVIITNGAKAKGGGPIEPSPDLTKVLGATDPGGALSAAWTAYAPLRTWAASKSFPTNTIINASVFRVGEHDQIARSLAEVVKTRATPSAKGWIKYVDGAVSPCAQGAGPATANEDFDELHALVTLPNFQKGTAPFQKPADGGDIELDGKGEPIAQGTVEVCMALTVPKKTSMPAGGWPLVIYAHGTGGSFRSHISEGVAGRLANFGSPSAVAVLGIDQVSHGTRRGTSTVGADRLFFNVENPAAARGNVLQGAADQMSLVRFAREFDLLAGSSPTNARITIDTNKIAFWGHSQGATEGSIAMPYTEGVTGALFSGQGASLIDSLLTKTQPLNISALIPLAIGELPSNVGATHPVLGMLQNAIDPADPLVHAAAIRGTGSLAKHVFMPFGEGDTYSTPITQVTYAVAANLGVAPAVPGATPDTRLGTPSTLPIGGTVSGKGRNFTAAVRQYAAPSGADGHFVVFKQETAKEDADHFLADALSGDPVSIPR